MDEIQRTLVKVGRKDLAHKYYQKVAQASLRSIRRRIRKSINDAFLGREDIPRLEEELSRCSVQLDQAKAIKNSVLQNKEMIKIINDILLKFGLNKHVINVDDIDKAIDCVIFLLGVNITARQELIDEQKLFR